MSSRRPSPFGRARDWSVTYTGSRVQPAAHSASMTTPSRRRDAPDARKGGQDCLVISLLIRPGGARVKALLAAEPVEVGERVAADALAARELPAEKALTTLDPCG